MGKAVAHANMMFAIRSTIWSVEYMDEAFTTAIMNCVFVGLLQHIQKKKDDKKKKRLLVENELYI